MSDGKRFMAGIGVLAIMVAFMYLVSLIDDSRPSVRRACRADPSSHSVILGEDDDGVSVAWCRHAGLGELIVITLSDLESWASARLSDLESHF
jgi:hypothetical protein